MIVEVDDSLNGALTGKITIQKLVNLLLKFSLKLNSIEWWIF